MEIQRVQLFINSSLFSTSPQLSEPAWSKSHIKPTLVLTAADFSSVFVLLNIINFDNQKMNCLPSSPHLLTIITNPLSIAEIPVRSSLIVDCYLSATYHSHNSLSYELARLGPLLFSTCNAIKHPDGITNWPWCSLVDRWADFQVWDPGRRDQANAGTRRPRQSELHRTWREVRCKLMTTQCMNIELCHGNGCLAAHVLFREHRAWNITL